MGKQLGLDLWANKTANVTRGSGKASPDKLPTARDAGDLIARHIDEKYAGMITGKQLADRKAASAAMKKAKETNAPADHAAAAAALRVAASHEERGSDNEKYYLAKASRHEKAAGNDEHPRDEHGRFAAK